MNLPTYEEFVNDFTEMNDSYELTDDDMEQLDIPYTEWICKNLQEIVSSKLTNEKIMNYSIMLYVVNGIKMKFLHISDKEKHRMTANAYRRLSKWVLAVHKARELPVIKAFDNMLSNEIAIKDEAGTLTQEMRDNRLKILFDLFPEPHSIFKYLIEKFNADDDIPIGISIEEIDDNFKVSLRVNKKLVDGYAGIYERAALEYILNDIAEQVWGEED